MCFNSHGGKRGILFSCLTIDDLLFFAFSTTIISVTVKGAQWWNFVFEGRSVVCSVKNMAYQIRKETRMWRGEKVQMSWTGFMAHS